MHDNSTTNDGGGLHVFAGSAVLSMDGGDMRGNSASYGGWTGDLISADNPATLVMDDDKVVTATFSSEPPVTHTLTVHTVGSGSVEPGGGTYISGTLLSLVATSDPGWQFDSWSGDVISTTNPVSLTMDADKVVTATFSRKQYTLAVSVEPVGSGNVAVDPDQPTYVYGDVVILTVTPAHGWQFDSWSGVLTGSTSAVTLTMDADKTVTATFNLLTYTLSVNTAGDGAGSVSLDPPGPIYEHGTIVTLTATPDIGSYFVAWSGDAGGSITSTTVTMDGDKAVTATFDLLTYTLTVDTAGDGSGTVNSTPSGIDCGADCTQDYVHGTVVTLTAMADSGSTFDSWSGAGCSGPGDCVVTMDAAKQVTATFTLLPTVPTYTLTIIVSPAVGGTVTPNPPGRVYTEPLIYDGDTVVTLTANPASGYEFARWSGDLTGTSSTMAITMTRDMSVTASFEQTGVSIYLPLVVRNY